uniref:Inositol polyphosphate-4-phosphatase type II B n=1 Tax=Lates calcarifer TaxID=8187 RepID=A0A4W6BTQ6_LATCA
GSSYLFILSCRTGGWIKCNTTSVCVCVCVCVFVLQGPDESMFVTSVCFRGDYPLYHDSRIKVTVYHAQEPTTHNTRSFLGFTSFSIRDLLRSKEPHVSVMLCAQVCKVYRFQTEDQRWLLVREQLSETPLSFSLPKQLLSALIRTVLELFDLSSCFKSSGSKSDRHLQFVPTNLHSQRMEVINPDRTGVWYEVITFGAPADHHQAFKHGGLRRLLNELVKSALLAIHKQCTANSNSSHVHSNGLLCDTSSTNQEGEPSLDVYKRDTEYDEEEWDRAWANVAKSLNCIIAMVDRLQGREERPQELTSAEQQESTGDTNSHNTASPSSSSSASSWQEQLLPLVVTLRDCVREAVGKARAAMTFVVLQGAVAPTVDRGPAQIAQRRHAVFSQALSAVVCGFMLKLYGGLEDPEFLQQLLSVGVLAQFESLLSTYGDEVGMLEDMEVGVADLSEVAFAVTEAKTEQPDDLLPTLRGTWGSFVVEVPLTTEMFGPLPQELKEGRLIRVHPVLFNIGINQQQSLAERFGDSSPQERVNQQSCERLKAYCDKLRDKLPDVAGIQSLSDLLLSLDRSVESRKRKNVEVLWIAAMVCRKVNGVRLTSCKSAKDRTAMSVTLEQCVLLRERHTLGQQHFSTALDCMRSVPPASRAPGSQLCLAPKAPRRHLYPVAFLLVTSHLLVLWLILSLVILLAKYQ